MRAIEVGIDNLVGHPMNSNRMAPELFEKLCSHIQRTGRYPRVVVREVWEAEPASTQAWEGGVGCGGGARYQILDGHHRVEALRRLGHRTVRCEAWDVDEAEALVLLSTLNRLEGRDHPRLRAKLLAEVVARAAGSMGEAVRALPEDGAKLERFLALNRLPEVVSSAGIAEMPVAVHFFLTAEQRRRLEARLRGLGGRREEALMKLVGEG